MFISALIYKKGSTDIPSNFRPMRLELVSLKIFTAILRNKLKDFLITNNFIETNFQNGFMNDISGTFDHTGHLP